MVRLDRLYLACPRCKAGRHPLDDRLGVTGFVSPAAQRLLCLAGASWSFDRAGAHLKEFCGLSVCDNTIRSACQGHGGAMRDWQRDDPAAAAAFRAADGDVEFQTDGAMVNTTAGWREMRLSIFAKRGRGRPVAGRTDWDRRGLPAPHARVIQAGIRTGDQLGPGWRRMAGRLGLRDAAQVTVIADGAEWIWAQAGRYLPGAAGVLDVYHAVEHPWAVGRAVLGEGTAECRAWVEGRRDTLLRSGAAGRDGRPRVGGLAGVLRAAPGAHRVCGPAGRGPEHRVGAGGGVVQAGGRAAAEADRGPVEGAAGGADGLPLRRPGQRPVGRLLGREGVTTSIRYCTQTIPEENFSVDMQKLRDTVLEGFKSI